MKTKFSLRETALRFLLSQNSEEVFSGNHIAVIQEVFQLFAEKEYSEQQIAGHLNSRKIPSPRGVLWSADSIRRILQDEQYVGSVVYNKTSGPLKSKSQRNPLEEWIITPDSYDPIISRDLFEKTQERFLLRKRIFSRDEIINLMKNTFSKYGFLTGSLIRMDENRLTKGRIRSQFGSIPEAFQAFYPEIIEEIKNKVFQEIASEARNIMTFDSFLVVDEMFTVRIEPAMPMPLGYGYQWFFRLDHRSVVDITLGVPLSDEEAPEILGYFPLPRLMTREDMFCLNDLSKEKMRLHGYVGLDFIRELIRLKNHKF